MDIEELIEEFNIKDFLDDRGVEYWDSGKNVTRGWINVRCLFCGDHSNHLGIHLKTKKMSCWKCGGHRIINYIKEVDECNFKTAKQTLSQFGGIRADDIEDNTPPSSGVTPLRRRVLPPEAKREFPQMHKDYLRERGFNPRKIIQRFNLRATGKYGDYKFRIIAPFYYQSKIVAFTGLDVTRKAYIPYKNSELSRSIIDPKRMLYNMQNISMGGSLGIVEGITDAWAIRDNVTATMGIQWTKEQFYLLVKLKIKRLFLIFDGEPEALRQAKKLARDASAFVNEVEIVELPYGKDPCDLEQREIFRIRKWLNS